VRAINQNKFIELRKAYSFFSYEDFKMQFNNNELHITYYFNISDKYYFNPTIKIPWISNFKYENLSEAKLKNIVFQIGMVELISYWKATCSPQVFIKPFLLEEKQIAFWKKIYYNGLGEFFYINSVDVSEDSFMNIECGTASKVEMEKYILKDANIIPVGGGKDSIVTLEILRNEFENNLCLIVNPRKASIDSVKQAGFNDENIIKVYRTIDPKLLELNDKGFLNGHTPFSALLAFISILTAALAGIRNITLSNESSANEATVEGSKINHQYSKSYEFERDFRSYVQEFVSEEFNYFSFLRPLSELQIAKLFSSFRNHFMSFRSCNVGSKTDVWCCKCPKCLFTFIVLSPFIPINELIDIYGQNIFDDKEMLFYFNQLIGNESIKPFECVGTVDEVNSALCLTINKSILKMEPLPYLLKYYKTLDIYQQFKEVNEKKLLKQFNNEHFLNKTFESILKKHL
jgi:UDP-N-acetyl-alpha-D-muramoyl-L-alanyl-L-glutamate epimerase